LFKKLLKVVIVIVLAYGVGRFIVVYKDSRLTGERAPYVQMTTTDSVVIRWLTDENEFGVVRYGEDSDHLAVIELENAPKKNHMVKLRNLKPGTRYFYQIGEINGFHDFDEARDWFKTSPDKVVPTRIWAIGDSGEPGDTLNQVRDAALNWMKMNPLVAANSAGKAGQQDNNPFIDVWISLGDIAYRSGTNEQYQAALFDTFDSLTGNTALWPVYGNHDDRRWTYFDIFDLPENGEAGGLESHTENYYAFDYSNVHFVMLDSQDSGLSQTGKMATWLKKDLAQNSKPWVIAAFHHPPYSKGTHDSDDESDSGGRMDEMRENILPILEQAGVDLVLSGHSHMYERSYLIDCAYGSSEHFSDKNIVSRGINKEDKQYLKPLAKTAHQGAVYVVAGSSSKVDQGPLDHPAHHVGLLEAGSVVVDVVDDKLTARFINNKGEVRDEFSITKEADYKSEYAGCK
jgi:predicted phosphodiesterase